jgi:hypothetical protein
VLLPWTFALFYVRLILLGRNIALIFAGYFLIIKPSKITYIESELINLLWVRTLSRARFILIRAQACVAP